MSKSGLLIEQFQKDTKRVIIGVNVQRSGLELTHKDLIFICERIAQSLNDGRIYWGGKIYRKATPKGSRVIIEPF